MEPEKKQPGSGSHRTIFAGLIAGLVVALAGNVYLWNRADQLSVNLKTHENITNKQIARLNEATTTIIEQRLEAQDDALRNVVKESQESTKAAVSKARLEAQQQAKALNGRLEEQRKQLADQLVQLQNATVAADSKIGEVSNQVSDVSTKVTGVSTDVDGVKAELKSTQSGLQTTGAELTRVKGDLGMLSGLIATNSKDLAVLRQLGERNYYEFALNRHDGNKKVSGVILTLKKTDPKRNRYTMEVLADDKRVEKKDKTVNEPVQLMVAGNMKPYEIVVNQVNKDQIIGYLSTPKVATKQ